jgi:hypothetical protein
MALAPRVFTVHDLVNYSLVTVMIGVRSKSYDRTHKIETTCQLDVLAR